MPDKMQRLLFTLSVLLLSVAATSQNRDRKTIECFNLGTYKVLKQDYKAAVVEFNEALRRDTMFLQAYENRGVAKYYLNDYEGAIEDYNKALQINPDDYNTFGRRGWAKFYLNDFTGAIADFTYALKGSQNDAGFYNIRGQAKFKLFDYQGAIQDFDRVIKSYNYPRYHKASAYYWRGLVKIETGQKKDGCSDLLKAGKLGYELAVQVADMIFCK